MAKIFGLLTVAVALLAGGVAPASAEFFGCKEPRTTVSYSSRPSAYRTHYAHAPAPRQRYATYSSQSHRRMASQWR